MYLFKMAGKFIWILVLCPLVSNAFLLDSMSSLLGGSSGSHAATSSATKLGSYNVNSSQISVSGLSAGGAMAVQFHVAYSESIMGIGSIAGIAYHCSQGQLATALSTCMSSPSGINPSSLANYAKNQASTGSIDATSHIADDKIFIWTGTNDGTVNPQSADKIDEFYETFTTSSNIKLVKENGAAHTFVKSADKIDEFYETFTTSSNIKLVKENGAAHTFPTDDYGNPCSMSSSPYISNCNYNGAYELLNFIYGGSLLKPTSSTPENGQFITFDQAEFVNSIRRRLLLDTSSGTGFDVNKYVQSVLNTYLPGGSGSSGSGPGSSGSGSGSSGSSSGIGNIWENLLPGSGSLPGLGGSLPGLGGSLPGLGGSLPGLGGSLPGLGSGSLPGLGGGLPGLGGTGGTSDVDSQAFLYVPSGCVDKTNACKLHVAFHGCKQGRSAVGDTFAKHAGYNKVGELNNIIILYPQVTSSMVSNPNGCFDWWGYSGANFDTKNGVQMKAVKKMIDRLSGF